MAMMVLSSVLDDWKDDEEYTIQQGVQRPKLSWAKKKKSCIDVG